MSFLRFAFLAACAGLALNAIAGPLPFEPLVWTSPSETNITHEGDVSTYFTFKVQNVSSQDVTITELKPSCGCTVAKMPSEPWILKPNESSKFEALVDVRGKIGVLYKQITVISTNAPKTLMLTIDIRPGTNTMSREMQDRIWGQQLTATDHQAVFKTTCVKCHLVPAFGKKGHVLYQTACGICHEAERRATMVPDLHALKSPIETNYWHDWVAHGKVGTLMPGFSVAEGGPLEDAQIDSLVAYLTNAFPRPVKSATASNDIKPQH